MQIGHAYFHELRVDRKSIFIGILTLRVYQVIAVRFLYYRKSYIIQSQDDKSKSLTLCFWKEIEFDGYIEFVVGRDLLCENVGKPPKTFDRIGLMNSEHSQRARRGRVGPSFFWISLPL